MRTRIIGTGRSIPAYRAGNTELETLVETNDAWIQERTGITARHLAGEETTVSMAAEAGAKALAAAGIAAEELDLVLVATLSADNCFPSTACSVQAELGAVRAAAFDIQAACTGFLYGLQTADAYIRSGLCKNILVIGSETMSKMVDWSDRGTCILFGDGAGAAVVTGDETGIVDSVLGADGSRGNVLLCENRRTANPLTMGKEAYESAVNEPISMMSMNGQEVFKFAVKTVPASIEELLAKTGTKKEEITYYLLHQANKRIIQSVAKRLKENEDKFPMNLQEYGNTSAASLAILLDEMAEKGLLYRGDKLILSGFGAGLTWGAMLVEW